ncbi:MAG: hypothetical protein NVSMB19_19800 [Vulcanimicrobiaceae bacterium]
MHSSIHIGKTTTAAGTLAALLAATSLPAWALSVTVNGTAVTFNPPPLQRAGRVFVPLRGVFERLGATVVYQGGVINATGNNRTIALKIGSTTATINGTPRTIDSAPFIVGASTYVPLRFVSEALGAGVVYDAANQVVALQTGGAVAAAPAGAPPAGAPPPAAPAAPAAPVTNVLKDFEPGNNAFVGSQKPTVSANFTQNADANTVHLTLDGLDITTASTRSSTGFVYAPPSPLQSIKHTVSATGKLASGANFAQSWSFTSGSEAPKNSLTLAAPADESSVGQNFEIKGKTAPNARIHIVAGATASLGGVFAFGAGNYTGDTIADGNGNFAQAVSLQTVSGATIGLTVTSTDPTTKESAQKKLRLRAQ